MFVAKDGNRVSCLESRLAEVAVELREFGRRLGGNGSLALQLGLTGRLLGFPSLHFA